MKISTKGRYGLEALVDLAIHASEGHTSLKSISDRQEISENYLEQLFVVLRRKGIVDSIRGAQGGYKLSKASEEITVGDVLHALEGPLAPVQCIIKGEKSACERYETCVTRTLWERVMSELDSVASSISLADLVDSYRTINAKGDNIEYFI